MKNFLTRLLFLVFCFCPLAASAQSTGQAYLTSKLNITTSTVVKPASGMLVCFTVLVAGAAGTINDVTTTGAVAASNQIAAIPAVVGYYCGQFPFLSGLVVAPGAAQVVSVSYQ